MGRDHHHLKVLHLRVLLQKPTGLSRQAVAQLLELQGLEAVEAIAGVGRVEPQRTGVSGGG